MHAAKHTIHTTSWQINATTSAAGASYLHVGPLSNSKHICISLWLHIAIRLVAIRLVAIRLCTLQIDEVACIHSSGMSFSSCRCVVSDIQLDHCECLLSRLSSGCMHL